MDTEAAFGRTTGSCVSYVKLSSGNHYSITDWNPHSAPHQASYMSIITKLQANASKLVANKCKQRFFVLDTTALSCQVSCSKLLMLWHNCCCACKRSAMMWPCHAVHSAWSACTCAEPANQCLRCRGRHVGVTRRTHRDCRLQQKQSSRSGLCSSPSLQMQLSGHSF